MIDGSVNRCPFLKRRGGIQEEIIGQKNEFLPPFLIISLSNVTQSRIHGLPYPYLL